MAARRYGFYFTMRSPRVLEILSKRNKKVYLVRQETMAEDLFMLAPYFGLQRKNLTIPFNFRAEYPRQNDTTLSLSGRRKLCDALKHEFNVLKRLETIAVNGNLDRHGRVVNRRGVRAIFDCKGGVGLGGDWP